MGNKVEKTKSKSTNNVGDTQYDIKLEAAGAQYHNARIENKKYPSSNSKTEDASIKVGELKVILKDFQGMVGEESQSPGTLQEIEIVPSIPNPYADENVTYNKNTEKAIDHYRDVEEGYRYSKSANTSKVTKEVVAAFNRALTDGTLSDKEKKQLDDIGAELVKALANKKMEDGEATKIIGMAQKVAPGAKKTGFEIS